MDDALVQSIHRIRDPRGREPAVLRGDSGHITELVTLWVLAGTALVWLTVRFVRTLG